MVSVNDFLFSPEKLLASFAAEESLHAVCERGYKFASLDEAAASVAFRHSSHLQFALACHASASDSRAVRRIEYIFPFVYLALDLCLAVSIPGYHFSQA